MFSLAENLSMSLVDNLSIDVLMATPFAKLLFGIGFLLSIHTSSEGLIIHLVITHPILFNVLMSLLISACLVYLA